MREHPDNQFPFDQKTGTGARMTRAGRNSSRRRPKYRLWPLVILLSLVLLVLAGQLLPGFGSFLPGWLAPGAATTASATTAEPTATTASETEPVATATSGRTEPANTPTPTPVPDRTVILDAVGDIILHQKVIDGGLVSGGKEPVYDYNPIFQYVRPIFARADLALANYEGTLAGPPYTGYPRFCAPDAIADALFSAGFRVMWTANNHTLDRGLAGVIRTAQIFQERGFQVIGTRPDEQKPADGVIDVKGVKIGLMAYTFETIGSETQKALNGIPMPAAADPLIDSFNPNRSGAFERDFAIMLDRAALLRRQGAELICLSLHWGNEYQTRSSSFQREMAQSLADAGFELIIGHHPHVLQEIDVLTSATTGQPTLVFYSISNFLHNMDYITHGSNGNAQDAIIARIEITRSQGRARITRAEYIPTYVVRVAKGNGLQHLIVPVLRGLADPAAFQTTTSEMTASRDRIRAVLGQSQGSGAIPVSESAD